MPLTDTQEQIERALRLICADEPIATAQEIADETPFSRVTVHENMDEILEERGDLEMREVGQAKVYYVAKHRMEELAGENVESVHNLVDVNGQASYAVVSEAEEDSDYDYQVRWYNYGLEELETYVPTDEQLGNVLGSYALDPVRIQSYNEKALHARRKESRLVGEESEENCPHCGEPYMYEEEGYYIHEMRPVEGEEWPAEDERFGEFSTKTTPSVWCHEGERETDFAE